MAAKISDSEKLNYKIFKYSSYATSYLPENILEDTPDNQSSRWSSNTNDPPQYLILKLDRPAVVDKIKFGKFEKSHVCNLKKFRVYGGLDPDNMTLLLENGLKNDNVPEVFNLRCMTEEDSKLPLMYVKIEPLLAWGPSFNFSIWYIELLGQDDPVFMGLRLRHYHMLREIELIKLCMKHFREQGYDAAFKALQAETNVRLEDNKISRLYQYLVEKGDFAETEKIIAEYVNDGLMDCYVKQQDYRHHWQLQPTKSSTLPGTRGGHQLVMNTKKNLVYLFGGWDGFRDLSDLWVFDIATGTWSLLCKHSEKEGGPTPRSCHKMIFDPVSESIFMLGRYLDNAARTSPCQKSDFYLFNTQTNKWFQICHDTSKVGGPAILYDHQMCIDVENRMIYVFGGKILSPREYLSIGNQEPEYSGLFSYHIITNTWVQLMADPSSVTRPDMATIQSRVTHCMVFHNKTRKLYIYGGQRGKEDIYEFISLDVDTLAVEVLNKTRPGYNAIEPSPEFTLRATIDCDKDEIYVFSSLSKQKDRRETQTTLSYNSFWVYSLTNKRWSRIFISKYAAEIMQTEILSKTCDEPCPRFAHQLIYDDVAKVHYLFGGNPGKVQLPQLRLDDFWILVLEKPNREDILKQCQYLVRKLEYEEITKIDPLRALDYLQTHISEVVDHSNPEQLKNANFSSSQFHKLAALLFRSEDIVPSQPSLSGLPVEHQHLKTPVIEDYQMERLEKSEKLISTETEEGTSLESFESASTLSENTSCVRHHKNEEKSFRKDYIYEVKSRRTFLFNKIVRLMPSSMVQPKGNLSDFIVI